MDTDARRACATSRNLPFLKIEVLISRLENQLHLRGGLVDVFSRNNSMNASTKDSVWEWVKRVGGVVAILAVMFGVLTYIISAEIGKQLNPAKSEILQKIGGIDTKLATLDTRIGSVEKRQDSLERQALPALLAKPLPNKPSQLKAALEDRSSMVATAKERGISIDPQVVAAAGEEAIKVGTTNPQLTEVAWSNVSSLIDYRSFLNASLVPQFSNLQPAPPTPNASGYHYSITLAATPPNVEGGLGFHVSLSGTAPPAESALLDSLLKPPPPGSGSGAQFLIVDAQPGVGLSLDDSRMRNVVIRNAIVFYSGHPAVLDNVSFVNCTFKILQSAPGKQLGEKLLTTTNAVFKFPSS
jgi:hypothetical protein